MFQATLKSAVLGGESCYLKPLSTNFGSIDSVLYDPNFIRGGLRPLIGLQMTDAQKHDISVKGLAMIQKSLHPKDPSLKSLRPSSTQKWIICFVVPAPMGVSFVKQGFKDPVGKSHWDSKISQHVLELPTEEVWKSC